MSPVPFLLIVPLWPLLLAAVLLPPKIRPLAWPLAPWAALPALLLALAFDDGSMRLEGVVLGGVLRLDESGRPFLLLASVLSLATGLLTIEHQEKPHSGYRFVLLLLLATCGATGLAMAGDALLLFTFSTILGYALYGMLVSASPAAISAARVFVVLLVLSDLALFELLLELAHKAGGIEFLTLQQALAEGGFPPVIFFLLLLALGSKLGLIGFHIWLAPSFVHAAVAVRPMLVYYILGAGLLGWLRLLPLGEIYWPGAGSLLQWLAMTGAIYALAVGLLQTHLRSLLAYGVMALAALLLWVLGAVLEEPGLWSSVAADVHNMAAQAGFALALLFLHPLHLDTTTATWLRRGGTTLNWLGVLVLASSPLGLIVALSISDAVKALPVIGMASGLSLLAGRSRRLKAPVQASPQRIGVMAGLGLIALLVALNPLLQLPFTSLWEPALYLLIAVLTGWSAGNVPKKWLPAIPPGDVIGLVEQGGRALFHPLNRLAEQQLPHWRKRFQRLLQSQVALFTGMRLDKQLEAILKRWAVGMLLLLLLGLGMAWWGSVS